MRNVINLLNNKLFKQALEDAEKEIFLQALAYCKNNQSKTARLLGVARGTLISKLKRML